MHHSTTRGPSLATLAITVLGALLIPACGSSESLGPPQADSGSPPDSGSALYCGTAGATCCAAPGQTPNPQCDVGTESLCAASTCSIAASCGSTAATSCEPLASNTGATKSFRMRRILLVSPPSLATQSVQNLVANEGVDMQEPQCGEKGNGGFNWLLQIDTAAKTLQSGGAPPCDTTGTPSCDPFTTGYCFVNKTVGGIAVAPVTAPTTTAADGTLGTAGTIPTLNIPIYLNGAIVLLPLSSVSFTGVKVSPDGNCIGTVNTKALGADCSDNYLNCSKWLTDGSITGYITLREADQVQVSLLNKTLCAILTNKTGSDGTSCPKDANGKIIPPGDYCSSPQGPAGCGDAFWLTATFAASAVNINSGAGVPDCAGGTGPTDAAAE